MNRPRKPSSQTLAILQALLMQPAEWRYGYDLGKALGLQSGTLYPVLMRLTDAGMLESEWRAASKPGAPPRHAYRLTPSGRAYAMACLDASRGVSTEAGLAPA